MHLIVLAAGSARRFGEDKLLWLLDDKPMIVHTLDKLAHVAKENHCDITLVTKTGPVQEIAARYPIKTVLNPDHEQGISSSIKCALDSLPDDALPAVFFVADQPWMDERNIAGFISGYAESGMLCGCVSHNGEPGNPCAFSRTLFDELYALNGDRGGKKVLMKHFDNCFIYEIADSRQLTDIDTKPI